MKNTKPPAGARVYVRTQYPSIYYGSTSNFEYYDHIGTVTEPEGWFQPDWFGLDVGLQEHSIISMNNVAILEYLDGTEPTDVPADKPKEDDFIQTVQLTDVPSSKGDKYYRVTQRLTSKGTIWHCECPGFGYRGHCRHIVACQGK